MNKINYLDCVKEDDKDPKKTLRLVESSQQGEELVVLTEQSYSALLSELEQEKNRVNHLSKLCTLGELVATFAHEISNPLLVIRGRTSRMQSFLGEYPEHAEFAPKILKMVDRIGKIVTTVRNFARSSGGDKFENTSVSATISDTLELCENKINRLNIELNTSEDHSLQIFECRHVEITQVLLNLISNSCDAIKDLPEKWIELKTVVSRDYVEFHVIDSGQGIPETIQKKITDSFFTTKAHGEGTGIGLSISKRLVEEHNGELYLNRKNKNTEFVVKLPLIQNLEEIDSDEL